MKRDKMTNAIRAIKIMNRVGRWIIDKENLIRGFWTYFTADKYAKRLLIYATATGQQHDLDSFAEKHDFLKNPPRYVIQTELHPVTNGIGIGPIPGMLYNRTVVEQAQIPFTTIEVFRKEYMIFANEQDYQTALTTIQIMKD
jgi:hypothetical protein